MKVTRVVGALLLAGGLACSHPSLAWSFSTFRLAVDDDAFPGDAGPLPGALAAFSDPSFHLVDTFSDSDPLTNPLYAPNGGAPYEAVAGVPIEAGDAVSFASDSGLISTSAYTGAPIQLSRLRFRERLFQAGIFSVGVVFGAIPPSQPGGRFGIRLTDVGPPGGGSDLAELSLARDAAGNTSLDFRTAAAGGLSVIDSAGIPSGADLIAMALIHDTAGSQSIAAQYAYIDTDAIAPGPLGMVLGGAFLDGDGNALALPASFTGTAGLFSGIDAVQAEVFGVQAVPLPAPVWLLISALGLLVLRPRSGASPRHRAR